MIPSPTTLRQRRRRARLALEDEPRPSVECLCCGRLWVPVRQGRYCSRRCVERAGALRRRLGERDQLEPLATWLRSDGAAMRRQWAQRVELFRRTDQWPASRLGIRRAAHADDAERRRLLEAHRHLLEPMTEAMLIDAGWLMGPQLGRARESAMAQVDPDQARERSWGTRW